MTQKVLFKIRYTADLNTTKTFQVTPKELLRASEDNIVIVARPQVDGTKGIFALDVTDPWKPRVRGTNWYEVPVDGDVHAAIRQLNRDLDKFFGLGGTMSEAGRFRH